MGPDNNGECSCPIQHRCEDNGKGCIDDNLPPVPNDSCFFSKEQGCNEPWNCAVGTDCTDCGSCEFHARASLHWNPADCPSCKCVPWCDTGAPNISCEGLGLTSLLTIENKQALVADLSFNMLTALDDARLFYGMQDLRQVSLENNNLHVLGALLFFDLTAMTHLWLMKNNLRELDPLVFSKLTALVELNLNGNNLRELDPLLFSTLTAMTLLDLDGNNLSLLDAALFSTLTAITILDLGGNNLIELDAALFSTLTAMTDLTLSDNNLSLLDAALFSTLTSMTTLVLSDNNLSLLDASLFTTLTAMTALYLGGNNLRELDAALFSELTVLKRLDLDRNSLSKLDASLFARTTNLMYLDLSRNLLATVDHATFAPFTNTLERLSLADNNIKQVDAVLKGLQQSNLTALTMEGNPSQCWIAADTYQNPGGSVVCSCAPDFEYVQSNDPGNGRADDRYLCHELTAAVVIPQTFATLRSKRFVLRGPKAQIAPSTPLWSYMEHAFQWNGYLTGKEGVTMKFLWKDKSTGIIDWTCNAPFCKDGGRADIVNPPGNRSAASFGRDAPSAFVTIEYTVIATSSSTSAGNSALQSPPPPPPTTTTRLQRAHVRVVYSAFHLPYQFDNAAQTVVEVVAGKGLESARVLRIKETSSKTNTKALLATNIDWLETSGSMPALVEPNPEIPTDITFSLINNTCDDDNNVTNALSVRQLADDGVASGWGVVVETDVGTMQPCVAVLQATDSVTGENLIVTKISASVQDCFESSSSLIDPRALSCNGHGTCNDDPDPYDGIFMGCTCIPDKFTGKRCDIPLSNCTATNEAFNTEEGICKPFVPIVKGLVEQGAAILGAEYKEARDINTTTFTEGDLIRIQGVELDDVSSSFSSGGIADVTFALSKGAPSTFFVSGETGEMFAYFAMPSGNTSGSEMDVDTFNVELLAEDGSGIKQIIRTMAFKVRPKPEDAADVVVATLASMVSALVLLTAAYFYRARQLRFRAHDFKSQLDEMRANGELDARFTSNNIPREIKRSHVVMANKIGQGGFGDVWKGVLDESQVGGGVPGYLVAVKTTKAIDREGTVEMLKEATVMALVERHPNIVSLIGVVTSGTPLMLLITFCEHGALSSCLKKKLLPATKTKLNICLDVARGMAHLANNNLVHRDLAARNCLLDSTWTGKVADFGLSRVTAASSSGAAGGDEEVEEVEMYYKSARGQFAVRWTAPESMETLKYTAASDVWSFGVTLHEIYADAARPYKEMDNAAVIKAVQSGYRMPQPDGCPDAVFVAITSCCNANPMLRPSFAALEDALERVEREQRGQQPLPPPQQQQSTAANDPDTEGSEYEPTYSEVVYKRVVASSSEMDATASPIEGLATTPLLSLREAVASATQHAPLQVPSMLIAMETSIKFGENLVRRGKSAGLTVDQAATLHLYSVEAPKDCPFYSTLNGALGGWGAHGGRAAVPHYLPYIKLARSGLALLPKQKGLVVYRGVRSVSLETLLGGRGVGDTLTWWAFTSTTSCSDVLRDSFFLGMGAEFGERTVFKMTVNNGASIKNFSDFGADFEYYLQPVGSTAQNEEEILLPPGTTFVIDGIERYANGITEVSMHETTPSLIAEPNEPTKASKVRVGGGGISRKSAVRKGSVYEGFGDAEDESRL